MRPRIARQVQEARPPRLQVRPTIVSKRIMDVARFEDIYHLAALLDLEPGPHRGHRPDCPIVTQLIPLTQAVPPIRGKRGQPLRRPRYLYADRGYDHEVYRGKVRRFQITPHLARRGTGHGSGLGACRWIVEGAIALLHWFRRLRSRWRSATTSTARSSPSAAPSSAGDDSAPHFVESKGRRCARGWPARCVRTHS